jgi:amino acid permease
MITLLGFTVSYIVFVKNLLPHLLEVLIGEGKLPDFMGKQRWKGGLFWAAVYTLCVLTPLSMPRTVGALRFTSLFGVL